MNGIEHCRKKAGLTQVQLADSLGVSQANISAWEKGKAFPSADKLPSIAEVLKCKIDDLFGK
jgi:transcriptional regulator with XRE-family HTH domain